MQTSDAKPFSPPTPKQVDDFLSRNSAQPPSFMTTWFPMIAMSIVLGLSVTTNHPVVLVPLWLCVIGMMIYFGMRAQWHRAVDARVNELQQMAMLRHFSDALRLAWRTLPSVRAIPELHGRTVLMIAHCLDHLRQPEAALIAYENVIRGLPGDLAITAQLQIQQAMTQLAADHLLDADRALRKLRSRAQELPNSVISGSYRLACLVQQSRTHHFADAVNESQNVVEELRPLGIEAGYGHALLALAHDKLASRTSPEALAEPDQLALHAEQARRCWERATLLLSPESLVDRYPELSPLAARWGQPHAFARQLFASPARPNS